MWLCSSMKLEMNSRSLVSYLSTGQNFVNPELEEICEAVELLFEVRWGKGLIKIVVYSDKSSIKQNTQVINCLVGMAVTLTLAL